MDTLDPYDQYDEQFSLEDGFEDDFSDDFAEDFADPELDEEAFDEYEATYEMDSEGDEFWSTLLPIIKKAAPYALRAARSFLSESDELDELDEYSDGDWEDDLMAGSHSDLTEVIAYEAAKAPDTDSLKTLVGAVSGAAIAKAHPKVKAQAGEMVKQCGKMAKTICKVKGGKKLLPIIAQVQKASVKNLNKQAAQGKPITKSKVKSVIRKKAKQVLSNPVVAAKIVKKNAKCKNKFGKKSVLSVEKFA